MAMTTTYTVTGMTCGHCAAAITEEVSELNGVNEVRVDHEAGTMSITSETKPDFAAVKNAVEEAGDYEVSVDV